MYGNSVSDVLIVGAGPTGLTMACECRRRGLSVVLIDKAAGPTAYSKAIVVHARTLEIFEDMGIASEAVSRGVRLGGATMRAGGQVVIEASFSELDTRYPFLLSISQADTEALLREHLAKLGGEVMQGCELLALRQHGTGVEAKVRDGSGERTISAAWAVGCDGAHSAVRKILELPFEGSTYDERFLLADVKIEWDFPDDRISAFFADDGLVACFPMRDGRWRLLATDPVVVEGSDPAIEEVQALFSRRTQTAGTLSDAAWLARFKIHCRQVARYRDDRIFLAGDAAHIHSPAGGQGMNTGIQDAHNLAWKLALVHSGRGRGRLLDSYEAERHAIGQSVLKQTDLATKVGTLKNPVAKAVRNELSKFFSGFEAVREAAARQVAELEIAYESSPIVREDVGSILHARIGTAAGAESPTVGTARDFASGPRPGRRALDGRVTQSGKTKRLMEIVSGLSHTLLLFDGRSESAAGYAQLAAIHDAIRARFDEVRVFVVTPRSDRPKELPPAVDVLLDGDGELERKYGATSECAYVIRPDLYVGYRSQPVDLEKLTEYLKGILR